MAKRIKNNLDDMQIKRLMSLGKPFAKSDGEGLTFTFSKAGTASWILRYRISGKAKELTIGNYPDITLSHARKLAREYRVNIDTGGDPALDKRKAKSHSKTIKTVNEIIEDFKSKELNNLSSSTISGRLNDFEKVISPKIGKLPVDQVNSRDIVAMIESSKKTWTISNRILSTAKLLFDHACGKKIIAVNPVIGIRINAIMGSRPPIKKRTMLSTEELRTLLPNIDGIIGTENALAFLLLLSTCVRTSELINAKWEYINFEKKIWWIPDESTKTRNGFLVPLTATTIKWFKELKLLSGGSEWVLPARYERRLEKHGGDINITTRTLGAALERAFKRNDIETRKFTPHDTRSTAKGHLRNMGVSGEVSELALNHKLRGIEGIYDVREEIPEKRAALELWASFIDACHSGNEWTNPNGNKPINIFNNR